MDRRQASLDTALRRLSLALTAQAHCHRSRSFLLDGHANRALYICWCERTALHDTWSFRERNYSRLAKALQGRLILWCCVPLNTL